MYSILDSRLLKTPEPLISKVSTQSCTKSFGGTEIADAICLNTSVCSREGRLLINVPNRTKIMAAYFVLRTLKWYPSAALPPLFGRVSKLDRIHLFERKIYYCSFRTLL